MRTGQHVVGQFWQALGGLSRSMLLLAGFSRTVWRNQAVQYASSLSLLLLIWPGSCGLIFDAGSAVARLFRRVVQPLSCCKVSLLCCTPHFSSKHCWWLVRPRRGRCYRASRLLSGSLQQFCFNM